MIRATWNGVVIAESDRTKVVEGNHYFPVEDIDMEMLEASDTRSLCFWKGVATYYSVVADGARNRDAAWTYRRPSPFAKRIKDHVAFWHGVEVERVPSARAPR